VVFSIVGSERFGIGVADRGGFNFWRWLSLIFFAVDFLPKENLLKIIFDWSVHRNGFQKIMDVRNKQGDMDFFSYICFRRGSYFELYLQDRVGGLGGGEYLLLSKIPGNVGMTEWLGQLYLDTEHALSVELLVFFYGRGGLSRTILSLVMANAPLVFPLPQGINNEILHGVEAPNAVCSMADIWIEGTFGPLFVGIAHELACSRNRLFFAGKVGPGGRVVYKMLLLASARSWLEASLGMTLDLKAALDKMFTACICLVDLARADMHVL
jgi:hypothetical protein